jgi:hypothetical protein
MNIFTVTGVKITIISGFSLFTHLNNDGMVARDWIWLKFLLLIIFN